ncbi:MAG TPA: phenylalanine--tRNA ligase subunit alpha, partial [Promineifilum sp.]|nr:phenylalanine--tRNA ligase subunit alpha [Promineifilum sp.]
MLAELETQYEQAIATLASAEGREALEAWYRDTLGKKGGVYLLTRNMGALSAEERPAYGRRLNEVKAELEAAYGEKLALAEAD